MKCAFYDAMSKKTDKFRKNIREFVRINFLESVLNYVCVCLLCKYLM